MAADVYQYAPWARFDPRSSRECQLGRGIYAISCLAAAEIITSPPVTTATSRIAVRICTAIRSTKNHRQKFFQPSVGKFENFS